MQKSKFVIHQVLTFQALGCKIQSLANCVDCRGCISKHISTVTIRCFSWEALPTDSLVRAQQLNCDFRTLPNISKHPRTAINCSLLGGDESWRPSASAALKLNCNYFQISTEFLVKSNAAVLSLQCLYLSFRHFPSWRKFNSNNYHHQSNWDGLNELLLWLAWELSDDAI